MDFDKIYTFSAIFKYCITAENIEKVFFYLLLSFPDKVFIFVLKMVWEKDILIAVIYFLLPGGCPIIILRISPVKEGVS